MPAAVETSALAPRQSLTYRAPVTKVGLVLGGGGATGHGFHAGVLAALADEVGFRADDAQVLVGTSAGAMVSVLVRAGLSAADLYTRACGEAPSAQARELMARLGPAPLRVEPPHLGRGGPASPARLIAAGLRPWNARIGTVAAAAIPEGGVSSETAREEHWRGK